MDSLVSKPKVFLSHSKVDISFVDRVHSDLRKCQIDPWLDSEEIRHGKPWLEAIFEHGIPACDCVLFYFSEKSIDSKMVKKEMDAGILQQLKDGRVAFLPYVSDESVRKLLRVDIQALQIPVWNLSNYDSLLPRVVSEIWRSFTEKTVSTAVQTEQIRRLQAELELEKLKNRLAGGVFSSTENADFGYIWKSLSRMVPIVVTQEVLEVQKEKGSHQWRTACTYNLHVNVATVLAIAISARTVEYRARDLDEFLGRQIATAVSDNDAADVPKRRYQVEGFAPVIDELMMFGFVEIIHFPEPNEQGSRLMSLISQSTYRHVYTQKLHRFRYWLAHKGLLPDRVEFAGEDWEKLFHRLDNKIPENG